jgi:hypothetical protein
MAMTTRGQAITAATEEIDEWLDDAGYAAIGDPVLWIFADEAAS